VTLSETGRELHDVAHSHGWPLDGITICDLQGEEESLKTESQYTLFHPSEVELSETTRAVIAAVEQVKPTRIVFDSLSEMRLLARDPLRYPEQDAHAAR
jgi:circadian clock protein KaiC